MMQYKTFDEAIRQLDERVSKLEGKTAPEPIFGKLGSVGETNTPSKWKPEPPKPALHTGPETWTSKGH
jgi:hypothetical protein